MRPVVHILWLLTVMHAADVADVQPLVAQSASARTAVSVASVVANCMPPRVMLAVAMATLYGDAAVRTGAESAPFKRKPQ